MTADQLELTLHQNNLLVRNQIHLLLENRCLMQPN